MESLEYLTQYADKRNIKLKVKDVSSIGRYPLLLEAVTQNNAATLNKLIGYANKTNVVLDINASDPNRIEFIHPLPELIFCLNYIEIINILIGYANKNNIGLETNFRLIRMEIIL